jgi:hypothetical protein
MSIKVFLFWTMIQFIVGLGSALIVANMWSWVDKLPVWPSFNLKKWLLVYQKPNNKQNEFFFASSITTIIACGIGYFMFN